MSITLRSEHFKRDFDYLIYKDGDYYKILNGDSLAIDYKDEDAATAIAKAIEYSEGGKIFLKNAEYPLSSVVSLKSNILLESEGNAILRANNDDGALKAEGAENILIRNLKIVGYDYTKGIGLHLKDCNRCRIENVYFEEFNDICYLQNTNQSIVQNCSLDGPVEPL
ncbi:MAG: hypothetical protein DRJ38_00045 [Thermoprotei archaeon]|nr:MAG: hypothetical protein DRJ38_00045 [Thermoprotei archaeon]